MSELPRKAQDRVNAFGVVLIGVVAAVLLWVSVVALQAYYYSTAGALESERDAAGKSQQVRDLKAKQRGELQEGKYVDVPKKLVTIPLDDAMKLVLRDAKMDAKDAPSLVPAVGTLDKPTIPAVSGRPPDNVAAPPGGAAPPAAPGGAAPPAAPGGAAAPAATPPAGATPPASGSTPTTPAPDASGAAPAPAPAAPPATPTPTPPSPPPTP